MTIPIVDHPEEIEKVATDESVVVVLASPESHEITAAFLGVVFRVLEREFEEFCCSEEHR